MSMRFFARGPQAEVLKEDETEETVVISSSPHLLVLEWRSQVHFSRSHARWVRPVRGRNQFLDEARRYQ
jgi:hypothetical protein